MKIKALKEEQNNASTPSGGSGAYKVANSISMMRGDNKIDVSIVVNVKAGSEDEAKRIANEQIKKVMSYVRGVDDEDVFGTSDEMDDPFADGETVPQDLDQMGADDYPDDLDGGGEVDPQLAARDFWDNEGEGTSDNFEDDKDDLPPFKEGKVTEGAKSSSKGNRGTKTFCIKENADRTQWKWVGKFNSEQEAINNAKSEIGGGKKGENFSTRRHPTHKYWQWSESVKKPFKEGFNINALSISQIEEMVVKTARLVECVGEISKIVDSNPTEDRPKVVADIARTYVNEYGADWSKEEKDSIVNKAVQKYSH